MKNVTDRKYYQINAASLEKIKSAATGSSTVKAARYPADSTKIVKYETLKPGEAELWQFNQFLQCEERRVADGRGVLHAEEIKEKCHDGSIIKKIRLYIRPEENGRDDGFFAKFKYKNEQQRAAELIATLAKAYKSAATIGQPGRLKGAALERLISQAATLDIETIASCMQDIALGIEAEKFKKSADSTEEHNCMREQLRNKLPERTKDEQMLGANEAAQALKHYGFKPVEVRAFHTLVDNIIGGNSRIDDEQEYAIRKFQERWIGRCEEMTDSGKSFRTLICANSEYTRWNMVAHHLAKRTRPKFDLYAHKNKDYVMLPDVKALAWQEAIRDEGVMHDLVKRMHAEAKKNNTFESEKFMPHGQRLFAAQSLHVRPDQKTLELQQRARLERMYNGITAGRVESHSTWVLTPLFNYTENTIDQCVAIMLRPFKKALEEGKTSIGIEIFSADPRITCKFNEAWENLKKVEARKSSAIVAHSLPPEIKPNSSQELKNSVSDSPSGSVIDTIYTSAAETLEKFKLEITMPTYTLPAITIPSFLIPAVTMPTSGTPDMPESADEKIASSAVAHMPSIKVEEVTQEKEGPHQGFGSYDEALEPAELEVKRKSAKAGIKKKHTKEVKIADPTAQKVAKVELQLGITEKDWTPDQATIFLLTISATKCLQPEQQNIMPGLNSLLKSDEFKEFIEIGTTFKLANTMLGSNNNRYISAAKEFSVNSGALPIGLGKLDDSKASDIAMTYIKACGEAASAKISRLVATPCFSLPRTEMFANAKVYREAVAVMIKSLHDSSLAHPQLRIILVARSKSEMAIMEEAILAHRLGAS